jgi:hypothetical protein
MSARADAQVPAVPDDVDDPRYDKASGIVVLPLHIDWSGDPRRYDLDDPQQRARVYEQVLREGNDDDIRYFIDVDELVRLWTACGCPSGCGERGRSGWQSTADCACLADRSSAARRSDRG